ncbi:MAG: hypothetical protein JRF63_03870 [Deltaproteobacteria bacterium]|nr:hypothetical protein [Deltaproteobacteria bacterium]
MSSAGNEFEVPKPVRHICERLTGAGESAFVVGGSLRDVLLGRSPGDWDVATTATPQRVIEIFEKVIPTGIDHGTVTVLLRGQPFEVTTLRGEGAYSDGRHPDDVEFLDDIEEDLARRDFTVNAMALEPISGEFHDPFHGQADLRRKVIRAVGDPVDRFAEDGLRVLRAARFAAVLDFEIDPATLAAMAGSASMLARVSVERKRDELLKILAAEQPSIGLRLMEHSGMLPHVAPALAALVGRPPRVAGPADAWDHTVVRVDAVQPARHLRLAALIADCVIGRGSEAATEDARHLLGELRLDRKTQVRVAQLLAHLGADYQPGWTDADVRRFLRRSGPKHVDDLLALERADLATRAAGDPQLELLDRLGERARQALADAPPLHSRDLAVKGAVLMHELGLPSGPLIGEILDALLERVLEDPKLNNRDQLLDIARTMIDNQ